MATMRWSSGSARSRSGRRHRCQRDSSLAGKAAKSGIGQFHLGRQAAETPCARLADPFQLSPDLTVAFGNQSDRDTLLGHGQGNRI